MNNIYSRWGKELGSPEKWIMLKNRIKLIVGDDYPDSTKDEARLIAFTLGRSIESVAGNNGFHDEWYINVGPMIDNAASPFELARILESFFQHLGAVNGSQKILADIINQSDCGIQMKKTKEGWLSYPSGEILLDKETVEKPLSFLTGQSLKEFTRALEHFTTRKWEECSEKTRRTLEEYLREKIGTKKGLDAAIIELGRRLEKHNDFPIHLKNSVIGILKILDRNANESSKHNSKTYNESECEFLIYQTGTILRLLHSINLT